jgi:hypothetical protein
MTIHEKEWHSSRTAAGDAVEEAERGGQREETPTTLTAGTVDSQDTTCVIART